MGEGPAQISHGGSQGFKSPHLHPQPRRSERRQRRAGGAHRMLRPRCGRKLKSQSSWKAPLTRRLGPYASNDDQGGWSPPPPVWAKTSFRSLWAFVAVADAKFDAWIGGRSSAGSEQQWWRCDMGHSLPGGRTSHRTPALYRRRSSRASAYPGRLRFGLTAAQPPPTTPAIPAVRLPAHCHAP
jgi:hypothetical protein